MPKQFKDVEESVKTFAREARWCAKKDRGFAAMLTIFPPILGLTESLLKGQGLKKSWPEKFLFLADRLPVASGWMVGPPDAVLSKDVVGPKLKSVRDSLAHQMSLPKDVDLATTRRRAERLARANPSKYVIITTDFVSGARSTALRMIRDYPTVRFDPWSDDLSRGAANRILVKTANGRTNTSGSSFMSSHEIRPPDPLA
jgi:hypothetical protein